MYGTCNRRGIGHIPSQCPIRDLSTIRTRPSANFTNTCAQSSNASANGHSDTGANSHVKPDLEAMDNSKAYYGDNALHGAHSCQLMGRLRSGLKRTTRSSSATTTTTTTSVTDAQLKALNDQGVANALAIRDADRNRNGEDSHDSGMGGRRQAPPARECTYQDFMKCKPIYFKGTEGVVELTQWFERMKIMFCISNCTMENQIKFATCTLLESDLTWWNSHVMTFGLDVAYSMTWTNLRKKMTDKMFPKESNKIERYIGGLPDMIYGSAKNKRKQDDNHNKKTRGRTLAGPTLLDLRKRSHMGDLSHCVLNATITMMACVLPNATSETELVIWPVTVGVMLLLTIRETLLAMNVGIKGTTRANAQS
nr:hypothetical protein [Tanacetum cinerariifolium]